MDQFSIPEAKTEFDLLLNFQYTPVVMARRPMGAEVPGLPRTIISGTGRLSAKSSICSPTAGSTVEAVGTTASI